MIRRRQSLSRNRSELSEYPWERQKEMAGRHQEWRDEIHGIFYTLIGVCLSDLEIKSKRKYRQWAQKLDAAKLLGFVPLTFMISFWFSRRSCCCRLLQLKEKTKTKKNSDELRGRTNGRPEWTTDCRESRVWKRQSWRISKRSRRRVEGVVLHKKSLVLRYSCFLETKTLVVQFQVIWGKCEAILQLTSTSSPPFPHSLLCFVFLL